MLTKPEKSKKMASLILGVIVIVQLVLCYSLGQRVFGMLFPKDIANIWRYDVLQSSVIIFGVFISFFFMFGFVKSLKDEYSPFSMKNVQRLKITSVILVCTEPIQYLVNILLNDLRPITENGEKITFTIFYGGIVFAVGLITFCVSMAFSRGVMLQNQSDETL